MPPIWPVASESAPGGTISEPCGDGIGRLGAGVVPGAPLGALLGALLGAFLGTSNVSGRSKVGIGGASDDNRSITSSAPPTMMAATLPAISIFLRSSPRRQPLGV